MFHSKTKLSPLILLVAALGLTGCWKPSKKDDPHNGKSERDATASFFVRDIVCEAVTPKVIDKVWKIADHKEVFARACVTDRKAGSEIKGHKFSVEFLDQQGVRQTELVTDDKGCFQWQEKISYNPLAEKSGYIELVRRIHGEGVHVGFRDVRIEVNPWAGDRTTDRQKSCKFSKTEQVSSSQKLDPQATAASLQGEGGRARLWMNDITHQITLRDERDEYLREMRAKYDQRKKVAGEPEARGMVDEAGAMLEVLLSMKPQALVEGMDGNPDYIPLKTGKYNIWVQLIASDAGDNRDKTVLLTPNLVPADGQVVGGELKAAVRLGLTRRVTRGRLELAIKVVPVALGLDIKPFEALYVLGDLDHILSGGRGMLSPKIFEEDKPFSYDNYVASAENFEELKKTQQALKHSPFIFETATVMFAGVRPGETATTRTVEYKVQSCVRDVLTGRRVQHQKFQIFDEKGKEILIKQPDGTLQSPATNQDGCLVWTSSLTHQYYKPEEFFFPKFKIVHPRSGPEQATIKELVMNPWDAMFRTFGFDRIEFPQEFIDSVKNREKIASRLFIPRYSYHAIRFRYEVDRFMELEVKKQILLNLRPEVLRYSGIIGGRKVTEALRDGIYLMKVAIQKDYLDPADKAVALMAGKDWRGEPTTVMRLRGEPTPQRFVTVVKKLIRVNAGEINTPVEFSVRDLRMMRIRSQFMVQLEPVDEQMLVIGRILAKEDRKKIEDLDKTRAMSDEMRRSLIAERRERLQANLAKLRAKLAKMNGTRMNSDKIAGMSEQELMEFDLTPELSTQVMQELKLNDFTVSFTTPIVDLDHLVEKDTGLERRSFVGPMIFLSNAYGDDLRPTDNLDETQCEVSDCDELKSREIEGLRFRNNYDTSKYFGSVAHLAYKHVDDLISEYQELQADYRRVMPALASVANFADLYNLVFITGGKEKIARMDWECKKTAEECARPADDIQADVDSLINSFYTSPELTQFDPMLKSYLSNNLAKIYWAESGLFNPVTREDFNRVALGGIPSPALSEKLCRMYALNLQQNASPNVNGEQLRKKVYYSCIDSIRKSGTGPLHMDYKVRVYSTGEYVYMGGKQMNLNVASAFGVARGVSFGYSVGAGFDAIDIPAIGSLGGYTKPFSLKLGVGGGVNRARVDATAVSESTYLVMQMASFNIQLKEYERCTVLKMDRTRIGLPLGIEPYVRNEQEALALQKALHRGWFICSGQKELKPLPVRESYYYFTQHFTEGDMLDQADLYNHPWLLAMRGARDFSTFAHLIREQKANLLEAWAPVVEKPGWSLDQMVAAYRRVLPTYPGIYTLLNPGEDIEHYPHDQEAENSFR